MPDLTPMTRQEKFLNGDTDLEPITRREYFYAGRESELPEGHQEPETREEWFIKEFREAGDVTVEEITITENGTTTAPSGKAYSPIHTNVPQPTLSTLEVSENGDYDAPSGTAYNRVEVNVPLPSNAYLLKSVTTPTPIASFNDGANLPMPSLKVAIEPQQDLHGYDAPWVGGAGKNKLPLTVEGIKNANTTAPWNGNSTEINGITYTILTNDSGVVIGINANGIASANSVLRYFNSTSSPISLDGQSVTITMAGVTKGAYKDNAWHDINTPNETTITLSGSMTELWGQINSGVEVNNILITPMVRLASVSDATFAPYSNICPISGWTEANVTRTGKNLFDSELSQGGVYPDSGNNYSSNIYVRTDFIALKKGTYTISQNIQNAIRFYDKNKNYNRSKGIETFRTANTITLEDDSYIKIVFRASDSSNITPSSVSNIQLEVGETATTYEPYAGTTYIIDLDGTRYGGEVDVVSGVMTINRASIKLNDLNWTKQNTSSNNWRFTSSQSIQNIKLPTSVSSKIDNLCSVYQNVTANETWTADKTGIAINTDGTLIICDLNQADTTALGAVIANQTYCYELATPLTIQLTPTAVKSLLGSNNVYANTGDIKDVEYFSKEV